jgi:hypothetical protein
MAEDERHRLRQVAVDDVQIAVAHPASGDPHEHLTLPRPGQVDLEDLDLSARLPENRRLRLHGASVPSPSA